MEREDFLFIGGGLSDCHEKRTNFWKLTKKLIQKNVTILSN